MCSAGREVISANTLFTRFKMSAVIDISKLSVNQKDVLIRQLIGERDINKKKLEKVEQERDALLCEVNRLKFELQISDIKRLGEDDQRFDSRSVERFVVDYLIF